MTIEQHADLLRSYFLNRRDIVAVNPGGDWNKPLPVKGENYLDALIRSHLTGEPAPIHYTNRKGKTSVSRGKVRLGFYTPTPDGMTRWGCLDFDGKGHADALNDPEAAVVQALESARRLGIPGYVERSGGGHGYHLWIFFEEPLPAKSVRHLLLAIAPRDLPLVSSGFAHPERNKGIEIFPKQDGPLNPHGKKKRPSLGNLVWLPFWQEAPDGANRFYRIENGNLIPYDPDDFETLSAEKLETIGPKVEKTVTDRKLTNGHGKASRIKIDDEAIKSYLSKTDKEDTSRPSDEWRDWREKALAAVDLEAVYGDWLTGERSGDGWLQCRDPESPSGDRDPSAGVADGTGDAKRATFHSFRTGLKLSVFDFLQRFGNASSFGEAVKIVSRYSGVPLPGKKEKKEKKEKKPSKKAESSPTSPRKTFPSITVNNRQMRSIVYDAWGVLLADNARSPQTFLRSGKLVRVNFLTNPPRIETIDSTYMHGLLMRMADWVRVSEKAIFDANPPRDVSRDMVSAPDGSLQPLEIVTSIPVFAPDGELLHSHGYHKKAKLWHVENSDLSISNVPEHPSSSQVDSACQLLLEDLLVDFPFEDEADKAHAVAALLLPFVRCMIDSASPLHVIEAPEAGTGKGLLADVISIVITGSSASITTLPHQEDEIRKKITTLLSTGRDVILWDNVHGVVDSSSLAAALTSRQWEDRKLGESSTISVPNNCLWLLTGNNPRLSKELTRRSIRIRLDSGQENPADRPTSHFKHPHLLSWARQHRSEIIHALLVLVRAWIANGQPHSNAISIGSYESWAEVIGGILQTAEIPGFLTNIKKLREQSDIESVEIRMFIEEWHRRFGSTEVKPGELNEMCEREEMLLDKRGDKGERSQVSRIGRLLNSIKERVYSGFRVKQEKGRKGMLYRLESTSQTVPNIEIPGKPPVANFDLTDLPDEDM